MDKEVKKAIKRFLWLDSIFESSDSLWGILDEIEDELEDIFGKESKHEEGLEKFFHIKNYDK